MTTENPETVPVTATTPDDQTVVEATTAAATEQLATQFVNGTTLEAAFIDPAYSFPAVDGEGKNAIELQASTAVLDDDRSEVTTESMKAAMKLPEKPRSTYKPEMKKKGFWNCCKNDDAVIDTSKDLEYNAAKEAALTARQLHMLKKKDKERQKRKDQRYQRVPEGILIYKLDTASHTLTLMSSPHSKTNMDTLMTTMVVADVAPSNDPSRRGITVTGIDGTKAELVACEQRTAIAWIEAMDLMLSHDANSKAVKSMAKADGTKIVTNKSASTKWGKERLNDGQREEISEAYLNLANYSNNLVRAGAIPGQTSKGGAGGIYYSMEHQNAAGDDRDAEALEAIAKRRSVIKDSWDFYRMICSLLRDKRKYDEVFRKMQLDPVYPYLNSMTGLNDPGDDVGYENTSKQVIQKDEADYANMTKTQVSEALVKKAEAALPSLVEICKALAGSLGMEEVGVGPIKEASAAIRKADKKYEGDLLKVTDYCRALLVVKDFPSLLALLELARDSFGPLIRRVKLSSLKSDRKAMAGGYRDCKINLELKDHICEIQIHLWPMWTVCGVDGFRHYRHCLEYSTDSFGDPYDALEGLDRKTMAELIVMAEEAVTDIPLDNLEWYQEKYILDYFAETGLFMKHGLDVWAEVTLKQLIKLRCESPDIGAGHHETLILQKYYEKVLRKLGKSKEADEVGKELKAAETLKKTEKKEAETSLWDSMLNAPVDAIEAIMDPNKKEREEEENLRKDVKASKKHWRKIRQERFQFLDATTAQGGEEQQ